MQYRKRLSIIIPFYNVEQYIVQCLDSIYDQDISEDEYEVICVDDCSPDNSLFLVQEYSKKHNNLVIVQNKYNRKLGGARNAGMEVAHGKYVWFVDSDDFIVENCLGKLLNIAESQNLDVLHFNCLEFPEAHKIDRGLTDTSLMNGVDLFYSSDFVWYHDFVTAWRKIHKRQFLIDNKIHFAEHIMYEDNDYAINVFAHARRTMHISDVVYYYRNNPNSITRVKYTSEHISYWIDLAHRLCDLKKMLIEEKKDVRLLTTLDEFIRYTVGNLINVYSNMDSVEKKITKKILRGGMNKTLKTYTSRLNYYKIKLGII